MMDLTVKQCAGVATLIMLGTPQIAFAQDARTVNFVEAQKGENKIEFAFGTPDSPALSLAGLNANEATKVDELQNFVISLPKFANGETALALDFSPASFFMPTDFTDKNTVEFYDRLNYFERLQRRTKMSVLARKGTENISDPTKSVKSIIAVGVSVSLLDSSDPLAIRVDKQGECQAYISEATDWIEDSTLSGLNEAGDAIGNIIASDNDWWTGLTTDKFTLENIKQANNAIRKVRSILSGAGHDVTSIDRTVIVTGEPKATGLNLLTEVEGLEDLIESKYSFNSKASPKLTRAAKTCYDAVKEARLYKPNLDIGAANLWRGSESGFSDFNSGGQALWLSYRHPVKLNQTPSVNADRYFVLGANGRFGFSEFATTGDAAIAEAEADTKQAWVGVELFSQKWRMAGQIGYVDVDFKTGSFSRSGEKWLVSADYRILDEVWVGVSYGEAQGTINALDGERLTVNLKFSAPKALNLFNFKAE